MATNQPTEIPFPPIFRLPLRRGIQRIALTRMKTFSNAAHARQTSIDISTHPPRVCLAGTWCASHALTGIGATTSTFFALCAERALQGQLVPAP